MQIFLDSANITEIEKWLNMGIIDGVTTNPSIMFKDGVYDVEADLAVRTQWEERCHVSFERSQIFWRVCIVSFPPAIRGNAGNVS